MTAPEPGGPAPAGVRAVPMGSEGNTRVVLIRHGEASCNVNGVVGGQAGCTGLSPLGRRQAQALRTRLVETGELAGASALYTSVLPRALETADIVAPGIGTGGASVADCDLCELHPGEADGLTWDEFRVRYGEPDFDTDPDTTVAPGGESWTGFVARASGAVARLAGAHHGQLVVVVCHAGVIESTLLAFLPVAAERRRLGLPTEHTSLTEWEFGERGWRLVRYNDAAHLRPRAGDGAR
jgi:broad specificity phosphatase PhoE